MGTEKPPSSHLGGFSCVVMLISFAKHIITQVPDEMQAIDVYSEGAANADASIFNIHKWD